MTSRLRRQIDRHIARLRGKKAGWNTPLWREPAWVSHRRTEERWAFICGIALGAIITALALAWAWQ